MSDLAEAAPPACAGALSADALTAALAGLDEPGSPLGAWRWEIGGVTVAERPGVDGVAPVRFQMAEATAHQLLTGRCHETVELARGGLVATGPTDDVLERLRRLPDVAARDSAAIGDAEFGLRPINVMRKLRGFSGDPARGFPVLLDEGPTDQAHLLALVLAGLPPACRVTQAADVAHALAADVDLARTKLVVLIGELADLVAGAGSRGSADQPCQTTY